ncbi:hypothetical protein HNQ07_003156 [Deinococcus metalli]|uniref:Uncharacterized protein n=1 Tax=Deinococcus metalli TaxID=1141878 RepID=A0A7W8KGF0_9DEIO|nr:hypothetical protein [Deinococcus metalli]MBB5377657.1 hypothetical protein [Deinococcus metalli]GHF52348.1 hypothetical protein GCM10017781_30840 [Deinococcus metalli]
MNVPLLLCILIALVSGLHAGRGFLRAHLQGGNMVIPALAHMAVSAALMVLSVLLDTTDGNLLWMIVATASMAGLGLGALLPSHPAPVAAEVPAQTEAALTPAHAA